MHRELNARTLVEGSVEFAKRTEIG